MTGRATDGRGPGHHGPVDSYGITIDATCVGHLDAEARSAEVSGPRLRFDVIYDELFEFVWRSARRLGVHEASVDDVAQDVFLVVHRRLDAFEGRSSVKTWLFGITLRVVSDWRRTKRRKGGLLELPAEDRLASSVVGPDGDLEREQSARLLQALLLELDDDKREVFVMVELEELSAPEVASVLSIPLNTVYSRLRVAREEFERALSRHRAKEASASDRARARVARGETTKGSKR